MITIFILHNQIDLSKNKGYGTKRHIDGIKNNGITKWHRKSFGICKNYEIINII